MALLDLSRVSSNISGVTQGKQVFAGEDDTAYRAMSNLGGQIANTAMDLYAKQMDIFTDRESLSASENFALNLTQKKTKALSNIDSATDLVFEDGVSTGKTYEEYIGAYIDEEYSKQNDSLTEEMSKSKFRFSMSNKITSEKTGAIIDSATISKNNTFKRETQYTNDSTNAIAFSSPLAVLENLDAEIVNGDKRLPLIQKTNGLATSQKVKEDRDLSFGKTAMEAALRNMGTAVLEGDMAGAEQSVLDYNLILGPGLIWKEYDGYKKYALQKFIELGASEDEAEQMVNEESYLAVTEENAKLFQGHPAIKNMSPEERIGYLNRGLSMIYKMKKDKTSDFKNKIDDLVFAPSTKDFKRLGSEGTRAWIGRFRDFLRFENKGNMTPYQVAQEVEKSAMELLKADAERELISTASHAYTTSTKDKLARIEATRDEILTGFMSQDEVDKMYAKYPELGAKDLVAVEKTLLALQRSTLKKMQDGGEDLVNQDRQYYELSKAAISINKDGSFKVNQKQLAAAASLRRSMLNRMGTTKSKLGATNILPDSQANAIMDQLKIMSPDQQRGFFAQVNAADSATSTSLYMQALREGKMDLDTAHLVANSQLGDSDAAKYQVDRILSMKNKITGKSEKELLDSFKMNGWIGDQNVEDLNKAIGEASSNNETLKKLRQVAKDSGLPDTTIQVMFSEQNIALITKDYMNRNSSGMGYKIWSSIQGKVDDALESAVKEHISSRVVPVTSTGIKAVIDPKKLFDTGDTKKIERTADEVTSRIFQGLKNNEIKLDFSSLKDSSQFQPYKKFSPELQQKYFLRDLQASGDIYFASTDTSGKAKELVLMIRDPKTGGAYRAKFINQKGIKSIPIIRDAGVFDTSNSDKIYNDNFGNLKHTEQLKVPSKISSKKKVGK